MKAITITAALLAALTLAACNAPTGPAATGASSSAPNAVSQSDGGGVGSANNSTHANGPGSAPGGSAP